MPVARAFKPWYGSQQDPSRSDVCLGRQMQMSLRDKNASDTIRGLKDPRLPAFDRYAITDGSSFFFVSNRACSIELAFYRRVANTAPPGLLRSNARPSFITNFCNVSTGAFAAMV